MLSETTAAKPRLVLFRWQQADLPAFIARHLQEQVACLAQFFDVSVVGGECDYDEVCDRLQPELTVFESGVYVGPRKITNVGAHPTIPRLGFIHSDGFCASRTASLSDMERWGITEFVTTSVAMAEYTPEIADRLFVWPNFAAADVYRDYGLEKVIPVYFTGSLAPDYPWRNRILHVVSAQYPSLVAPHAGWSGRKRTSRMVFGEQYAKMLNAASVVPACGTVAKEVVRKHFEIPAAASCLVTERTAALEAAGFVDMVNCVFATEVDVLDKLDALFGEPELLASITRAGHELVHARHTMQHRDELLQWLRLRQQLRPGQRIVQPGPFDRLITVGPESNQVNGHARSGATDVQLLDVGREKMLRHRYDEASVIFQRCLNYHFMAEPILLLSWCSLYRGDAKAAIDWVTKTIETSLDAYQAVDPDPVEWACLLRALVCAGRLDQATVRAHEFGWLSHPELARMRWAVEVLANPGSAPSVVRMASARRASVHRLPDQSLAEWARDFAAMLVVCGQRPAAEALLSVNVAEVRSETVEVAAPPAARRPNEALRFTPRRVQLERRLKARLRPYLKRQPDDLQRTVSRLAQKDDVRSALFVGGGDSRVRGALLAGLRANPGGPTWLTVSASEYQLDDRAAVRRGDVDFDAFKRDAGLDRLDLVLISGADNVDATMTAEATRASVVVLDGISDGAARELYGRLLGDSAFMLVEHKEEPKAGYAIFRRHTAGQDSPR